MLSTLPSLENLRQRNVPTSFDLNDFTQESSDDPFESFHNDKFVPPSRVEEGKKMTKTMLREQEAAQRRQERLLRKAEQEKIREEKQQEKAARKAAKDIMLGKKAETKSTGSDGSIFTDGEGTQLLGRERIELITKIDQYKVLFPACKKLQSLKIKKNPSVDDLTQMLIECEALVACDSVDSFVMDAVLQSIRGAEVISSNTRMNITGLSHMLSKNVQFVSLCKQLFLRYQVFTSIPPEYQLALIVMTSAWVCVQSNRSTIPITEESMDKCVSEEEFK